MALILNNILFLLFLTVIKNLEAVEKQVGPVGNIIVDSVSECPEGERPKTDDFVVTTKLEPANGKSLTVTIDSKKTLDDNVHFEVDLKKLQNDTWVNAYDVKGKPCRDLPKFINKIWNKFTRAFKPHPDVPCPLKAGSYTVEKFQVASKDLEIPQIPYGKLQAKITLSDKNEQLLVCIMAAGESQRP